MFRVGSPLEFSVRASQNHITFYLETTEEIVKITVKEDACVGSGQCALVAGSLFDQDDSGIVVVLNDEPNTTEEAAARKAASLCPARAITVHG